MARAEVQKSTPANPDQKGKKNILVGTILGYASLGLTILFGLVFTPWVITTIGQSQYGLFTLSGSIIGLFTVDFGLGVTANSFLAKYKAAGDKEGEARFLSIVYKLYLLLDVALLTIFFVFYFLIDNLYAGLSAAEKADLKVVYLVSASFSVIAFPTTVFNGVLQSSEQFGFLKATDIAARLLYVFGSIAALSLGWGLFGLVVAQATGNLIAIVLKFVYIRFKLHSKAYLFKKIHWVDAKPILSFSLFAGIVGICSRLVFSITPSILGIVSDSQNIAFFGVVVVLEGYIYTFGSVMNGFFLPKISRLMQEENATEKILELAIKVGRYQVFILGLAEIGFICCGEEFITLWMHGDASYTPAYIGTILVMVYQLVNVPQVVLHDAMYHSKKTMKHLAIVTLIKAVTNLGLSFLLSYFWGMYGACISIFLARTLELVWINVYYKRDLGINLWSFFSKTYKAFLIAGAPALAVGLLLHFLLPLGYLFNFFIIVASVVAIFLLIYFFAADQSTFDMLHNKALSFKGKGTTLAKKAALPALVLALALFTGYLGGRALFDANYGVAGTYSFYYEGVLHETFQINLRNEYSHVYYYMNGTKLAQPRVENYRWKLIRLAVDKDKDQELIHKLKYKGEEQIQICNDQWASYYQYYAIDGMFYTKRNFDAYGGEQKCFIRQ